MDSGIVVVIVISVMAVGLLIWLELHSRRKKRDGETGPRGEGTPLSDEAAGDRD